MATSTLTSAAPSVATDVVVRGHEITKRFGEGAAAVDALRGVSVEFARGSFTAIMGPSGSGKSTLMHILAGLDTPTSGWVEIDGTRLDDLDDRHLTLHRRREVGFIFQSYNLLPVLNAEQNIVLPVRIAGDEPDRDWLETLIKTVGLGDRRRHRPSELSGGQAQRVAVARALITHPAVVFADEPTGNLDSNASRDVLALLRRAVDDFGQTIVMVTHDAGAAANADSVLFLADGQIVDRQARQLTKQTERAGLVGVLSGGEFVALASFSELLRRGAGPKLLLALLLTPPVEPASLRLLLFGHDRQPYARGEGFASRFARPSCCTVRGC